MGNCRISILLQPIEDLVVMPISFLLFYAIQLIVCNSWLCSIYTAMGRNKKGLIVLLLEFSWHDEAYIDLLNMANNLNIPLYAS